MEAMDHLSFFKNLERRRDSHFLCGGIAENADLPIGQPDRIFRSLKKGLINRQDNFPVWLVHLDKEFLKPSVRWREEEEACGGASIPASTAALLIIGFYGSRKVVVHNQADVRTVDAHAKGIGGCYDIRLAFKKDLLDTASFFFLHPGMIPQGFDTLPVETSDNGFNSLSGSSIDNRPALKPFESASKMRELFF
jgi:hypothetical protein